MLSTLVNYIHAGWPYCLIKKISSMSLSGSWGLKPCQDEDCIVDPESFCIFPSLPKLWLNWIIKLQLWFLVELEEETLTLEDDDLEYLLTNKERQNNNSIIDVS